MTSKARRHYEEGSRSGYHECCTKWYLFRLKLHSKTGRFFNIFQPIFVKVQHILCPLHWFLVTFKILKFEYTKCGTCNNTRLVRNHNSNCPYCVNCKHKFKFNRSTCLKCGFKRNPKYMMLVCKEGHHATGGFEAVYDE